MSGSGQDVLLFKSHGSNVPTDWCGQAGRHSILFVASDEKTQSDVWMLPLTGERKPIALLRTPPNEVDAHCSPDGRWLAYSSDESGRQEIYVTSFPTPGGKWPISTSGGTQPQWRRDGTELFYLAPDRTVMSARVGAGANLEVGAVTPLFQIRGSSYAPSADGRRFVTNDPIGEPTAQPITIVLNWTAGLSK